MNLINRNDQHENQQEEMKYQDETHSKKTLSLNHEIIES